MANNLISDVMKAATPAVVDRIAASQSVNADVVRSVLAIAVPAIFAGIAKQAGTSDGFSKILASLRQMDPELAGKMSAALDGGANSPLVTAGTASLRQVIGDGALETIVAAISKNTGTGTAAGAALVAVSGQMSMSALARQAADLDPDGLLALLGSQMKLFQSSLPASLASALGVASNTTATGSASATVVPMRENARSAMTKAAQDLANDGGSSSWLLWLVPVIIVAAALWYYLGHKQAAMVTETKPPAQTSAAANTSSALTVDNVDVSKALTTSMAGLSEALKGVTDAASAQASVARLKDITSGISEVSGLAAKFTPEQKKAAAALVNAGLPALKEMVAKAEAIAGAGEILKPIVDPIVAQLEALAKT